MNISNQKGLSLAEVVIVIAIAGAIFMAVFNFGTSIFSFNSEAQRNLSAQTDARRVLKVMVRELREVSPASNGAYPLVAASATSVTFYANIDGDNLKERIRYFVEGSDIKKGVIKPSGSPLVYNPANEEIITLVKGINNGAAPVFEYFDASFDGDGSPLALPIQITQVRLVKISLFINQDPNKFSSPVIVESQVFLRNLKDNL
jgi:prepilin-type N-terminal cleavage/methylation domain-containing protein